MGAGDAHFAGRIPCSSRVSVAFSKETGCVVVLSDSRLCFGTCGRLMIFWWAQTHWIEHVLDVFFFDRAPDTARCDMVSGPPLCGRRPTASTVQGWATRCVSHGSRRCPMFTLLAGSWKWLTGSRSKPFFVPQGQPASYRFFPKSLAARFCTRLRLCGHCRSFSFSKASIKHSEGLVSMPARWCRTTLRTLFSCTDLHSTTGSIITLVFVFAQNTVLF